MKRLVAIFFLIFFNSSFCQSNMYGNKGLLRLVSALNESPSTLSISFTEQYSEEDILTIGYLKNVARIVGIGYSLSEYAECGFNSTIQGSKAKDNTEFNPDEFKVGFKLSYPYKSHRFALLYIFYLNESKFDLELLSTTNLGDVLQFHINTGYSFTEKGRKDEFLLLGLGIELKSETFTPFIEYTTEQMVNNSDISYQKSPHRITPGLKLVYKWISLNFGLELGMSHEVEYGMKLVPDWNIIVGIETKGVL